MKENTFVYKCPSCGGHVEFQKDDNKWKCFYCGNTYETLFKQEVDSKEEKIPKQTLYKYQCSSCNKISYSSEDEKITCTCGNVIEKPIKFEASRLFDIDVSQNQALKYYFDVCKSQYANRLPVEFFTESTFKCHYINCDLYNGVVRLEYQKNSMKFIFVNLLIPNIETDDYTFMYHVGNIGINNIRSYVLENNFIDQLINSDADLELVADKDYKQNIIDACVNIFAEKYKITDKDKIEVESSVNVESGNYLPFYIKTVNYNNKKYNQYIAASEKMNGESILEFPEIEDAHKRINQYNALLLLIKILVGILLIGGVFLNMFFTRTPNFASTYIPAIIGVCLIILYMSLFVNKEKNEKYYLSSTYISKDEYFRLIVNNSNYVKVIKEKK